MTLTGHFKRTAYRELVVLWLGGFPGGSVIKNLPANAGDAGDSGSSLGQEGNGNPLQDSCLENPMGQWSLVGYSPWGSKESDTAEQLSRYACQW